MCIANTKIDIWIMHKDFTMKQANQSEKEDNIMHEHTVITHMHVHTYMSYDLAHT